MLRYLREGYGMSDEATSLHTKKNVGGRPSERGESKRAPISMRTTPSIRAALEDAAERGGRSLAQEIEQRLERSVQWDEAYSPDTLEALFAIRSIMEGAQRVGAPWTEDLTGWEIVVDGVMEVLFSMKPERRDVTAPPPLPETEEVRAALDAFEQEQERVGPIRRKAGADRLRVIMKAQEGKPITEEEREASRAAWKVKEDTPEPKPALEPHLMTIWADWQAYQRNVENARALALAIGAAAGRGRAS